MLVFPNFHAASTAALALQFEVPVKFRLLQIFVFALLSSGVAQASCNESMGKAAKEYMLGMNSFIEGSLSYETGYTAYEESNHTAGCDSFTEAVSLYEKANKSFESSIDLYTSALKSCSSDKSSLLDEKMAESAAKLSTSKFYITFIERVLINRCREL